MLQKIEAHGRDWRIEGTAPSASAIIPILDATGQFADIHALGASNRFQDAGRTVESFTIAFRER